MRPIIIDDLPMGFMAGYASGSLYEGAVFDNNYISSERLHFLYAAVRLREKMKAHDFTFSIFSRNLLYLYKTLPYIDPEDGTGTTWVSRATSASSANAATRSFGASIRLTF